MGRINLTQDFHGYTVPLGSFNISEEGERVLRGNQDSLYSIDDAVERFMDEIDYYAEKLAEIEESQMELHALALREPLAMNYDEKFQELHWSWMIKNQIKTALERDLGELLGEDE